VDGAAAVVTGSGPRWLGRVLLPLVGLALVAYLVRGAGPARVGQVLWRAGSWLPVILALELVQLASDPLVLRLLLRDAGSSVPAATWVRSSAVAYALMILVPAGRAAGEVARGALLAKHVGTPSAATAGTQLQAAYLFANGLLSVVAWAIVASWKGPRFSLAVLLAVNAALMGIVATGLLAILWDGRVSRWVNGIRRRLGRTVETTPAVDPASRRRLPWAAAGICSVSRTAQVLQYGVILSAVGGMMTLRGAFVVHGVHLVGATLGDVVPGQLGVVDAAYRAFAGAIGFAGAPERALSIAFVAHAAQIILAGACVVVASVTRRVAAPRGATP
jgi:hypothetical protein